VKQLQLLRKAIVARSKRRAGETGEPGSTGSFGFAQGKQPKAAVPNNYLPDYLPGNE